jgi:hypothetical protein
MKSHLFWYCLLALIILAQSASAQKLVDPNTVAPEFRAAAEKRRAEQIRQIECGRKAEAAKVLPRDRAAHITQCLESESQKQEPVASHQPAKAE